MNKSQVIAEIKKSRKEFSYFFKRYTYIAHPTRGKIKLDAYDFQTEAVQLFNESRFVLILKARQLGLSTICAAYIAYLMLFFRDKSIVVISKDGDAARGLIRKIRYIFENLPVDFKRAFGIAGNQGRLKLPTDNKHGLSLNNGSYVKALAPTDNAGTSESLSLLIIDEAAKIRNLNTIWASAFPTISTGGRCIVLSTPWGVGGKFHSLYVDAENEINEFNVLRLPWHVHPDHNEEWFKKETRGMTKKEIAQEYLCSFLNSGDTVISGEIIGALKENILKYQDKDYLDSNRWIYQYPEHGKKYILVADVARGDGADYSTFLVADVENCDIVCDYKGKIEIPEFVKLVIDTANMYDKCAVSIENTGIGYAAAMRLAELQYENIIYSIKGSIQHVQVLYGTHRKDLIPGFNLNSKNRPLIINKMCEFISEFKDARLPPRLVEELRTFIWYNDKPQAMRGYNDDLIMPFCQMLWLRDIMIVKYGADAEALLDAMSVSTNTIKDVTGFKSDEFSTSNTRNANVNKRIKNIYGDELANFDWLVG